MALHHNPRIVTSGLVLALDAGDVNSYPGTGTTWYDTINGSSFLPDNGTPTYLSGTMVWDLERDSQNNFKSTNSVPTRTNSEYTRIAWFNPETVVAGSYPCYIFGNKVGNNSDLTLGIANSSLCYHQYSKANSAGTGNQDYTLTGTEDLAAGNWYMGAFTFSRSSTTCKLYVNGVLDTTHTDTRPVGDGSSDDILIGGADNYIAERTFDGKIAIVKHYNRVLTDSEIQQNYNATKTRFGL